MTDPPEIVLDIDTLILNGCPESLKKKLKEPLVKVAPLCTSRGPIKLSYVDTMREKDCVQYIDRLWLVRDGCGNLANTTQQIRIKRPEMRVTFPDDVRGKCHLGEVIRTNNDLYTKKIIILIYECIPSLIEKQFYSHFQVLTTDCISNTVVIS